MWEVERWFSVFGSFDLDELVVVYIGCCYCVKYWVVYMCIRCMYDLFCCVMIVWGLCMWFCVCVVIVLWFDGEFVRFFVWMVLGLRWYGR